MSELHERHCQPCEGGVEPLDSSQARSLLDKLDGWSLSDDGKWISKSYSFKNFYRTMSFVNVIAHVANVEGHHPDLEVGYGHCLVRYSTHAIDGLSENDFICAARIDAIETTK